MIISYLNITDKVLKGGYTKNEYLLHLNANIEICKEVEDFEVSVEYLEEVESPEFKLPTEFQKMLLEIETSSNPVTVMIFDYNNLHHNSEMRGKMFGLLKELDDVKVYLANTNREERYIDWRK